MAVDVNRYQSLKKEFDARQITLVAVSKLQSPEAIKELYALGHRDFGENYVQELLSKKDQLPDDIRWHFIGHLQSNKARQIVGHVQLIQGVDSLKLLKEINRQALKKGIIQQCLLQVHIAREESKFGLDGNELHEILREVRGIMPAEYAGVRIAGLMGMASLEATAEEIEREFEQLYTLYRSVGTDSEPLEYLSMGMSGDFELALKHGSNMVRIGSLLFGARR